MTARNYNPNRSSSKKWSQSVKTGYVSAYVTGRTTKDEDSMDQHGPLQLTGENAAAAVQCGDGDRVDEEILSELFMVFEDGMADGLVNACDTFRTSVPARLADIDAALVEGRFEEASRAAHSLRGSTGTFGARRLSALAMCLEDECGKGDHIAGLSLLDDMRAEFVIFLEIFNARMAQLPE